MEPDSRLFGTLQFVDNAVRNRLAHYREQAVRFRELAEVEPVGRLRAELLKLSRRYELLADNLGAKSRDES
jgi:hypothetical protein